VRTPAPLADDTVHEEQELSCGGRYSLAGTTTVGVVHRTTARIWKKMRIASCVDACLHHVRALALAVAVLLLVGFVAAAAAAAAAAA
jgi:hypothetical protein